MILFLSKYPETPQEFRDGFFQRVVSIDKFYSYEKRVYLHTSLFRNWRKKVLVDGLRTHISCNILLHFITVFILFKKSSFIYIQSIYNAIYTIFLILFFQRFYILDLHGVVPEELKLQNKKIHYIVFSLVEFLVFKKTNVCIAVTENMVKHFKGKYPSAKCKYIVYCILPTHLNEILDIQNIKNSDKVEIIYSGNTQVWQNIDLMLEYIKKNISDNINYTILTGEVDKFKEKIKDFNINPKDIVLKSVKPDELSEFYKKSNYGFILRDDILVNKVACPTKMVEYLHYGVTPIVLSEEIGDFNGYGFDYIKLNDEYSRLPKVKSLKNHGIVSNIFKINNFDLKAKIDNLRKENSNYIDNGF